MNEINPIEIILAIMFFIAVWVLCEMIKSKEL